MLISIITVVKNGMPHIKKCLKSVDKQTFTNFEHIIVYSPSNDRTLNYVKKNLNKRRSYFQINEKGIYTAINLGIKKSKGKYIFLLHSDDFLYDNLILQRISKILKLNIYDVVYGDIIFKNKKNKIIRVWKSGSYNQKKINKGWLPPHTSMFIKKKIFKKYGYYSTSYQISSDYDYLLNLLKKKLKFKNYSKFITVMRYGGISTSLKFKNIAIKLVEDFKIRKKHNIKNNFLLTFLKPLSKLNQYIN